jgi:hypothetical protein
MSRQYGAKTATEWLTVAGSAERRRHATILRNVMEGGGRQREQKTQENFEMQRDIWRGMGVSSQSQRPRSHHREIAKVCPREATCPSSAYQKKEGLGSEKLRNSRTA